MKIGTAPISWGVSEIDAWGPQTPYPQVLDEMAAAGYAGTELGPDGYLPARGQLLAEELGRRGLAMIAAFVPVDLRRRTAHGQALAAVERTARLLADLGARQLVLADGGDARRYAIAGRPTETKLRGMTDEQWHIFVDGVHEAAARCARAGLTLCFHPHGGSYVEHPDEIERLLDETDGDRVKLCLDTGHIAFGGGDPVDFVQRRGNRIGLVHLKDVDMTRLRAGIAEGKDYPALARDDVFVPLGRGSVDVTAIIDGLRAVSYDGWIVVEQDRVVLPGQDALTDARHNRRFLQERFGL